MVDKLVLERAQAFVGLQASSFGWCVELIVTGHCSRHVIGVPTMTHAPVASLQPSTTGVSFLLNLL